MLSRASQKIVFLFIFYFFSFSAKGQSVYYCPIQSLVGLSTNTEKLFWIDFKFTTNSFFSSLATDVAPSFTIVKKPLAFYYLNLGLKYNFISLAQGNSGLSGYFLSGGLRAFPLKKHPKVMINFEISPYAEKDFEVGLMRSYIGVGYNFDRK